jgi:cyanophycinase
MQKDQDRPQCRHNAKIKMIAKGQLLLIGGAEDVGKSDGPEMKDKNKEFESYEVLKEMLPNFRGKRTIEIITTATDMPAAMSRKYSAAFRKIGYKDVQFLKMETKQEAQKPSFIERVSKAHVVFFSGGDQFTLSAILSGTKLLATILEKYQYDKDFIVAGTSAGAMAIPKLMMYDGEVGEAILRDELRLSGGLGFMDGCVVDTHFIKRGRFGRLTNAVIMNPDALGIGLGEDTMLSIKHGTDATCRGSGSVIIIDGLEIGKTNITELGKDDPIYVENLKVHLLCKGCVFSLKDRKLVKQVKIRKK